MKRVKNDGVFTVEGKSNKSFLSLASQCESIVSEMTKNNTSGFCRSEPSTDRGKRKQMAKMLALVFIPVLLLWSLALQALSDDVSERQETETTLEFVKITVEMGRLVHRLQKERDLSTLFYTALGPSTKSFLIEEYSATDSQLKALTSWPRDLDRNKRAAFMTREAFFVSLANQRAKLGNKGIDLYSELNYYTSVIEVFVSWIHDSLKSSKYGVLWKSLVTYVKLITTRKAVGFERTLGTIFFVNGEFYRNEDYQTFLRKYFESKVAFRSADNFSRLAVLISEYDIKFERNNISSVILKARNEIIYNGSAGIESSLSKAQTWYDTMSIYLEILLDQQQSVAQRITSLLDINRTAALHRVVVSAVLLVLVAVISPSIFMGVQSLTSDVQRFAITLVDKTKELSIEKKKTDSLIYQILPKTVAQSLKRCKKVEGEYFKEVTIFFSDIVGFSEISAETPPMEVVTFLNNLYNFMDNVLDRYDVYKVETINSTYMIASGLPRRNGDRHALEIANLALELMYLLNERRTSFLSNRVISLRIGINTGPVVAGVVGCKMPRYCIFGDTVNTSSRLQTTSLSNHIHISASTRSTLLKYGGYVILSRGGVMLKGKGHMLTYWLVAKGDSPPVVNEELPEEKDLPGTITYGSKDARKITIIRPAIVK